MIEEDRVQLYHQLLSIGFSDAEARAEAWPEDKEDVMLENLAEEDLPKELDQ